MNILPVSHADLHLVSHANKAIGPAHRWDPERIVESVDINRFINATEIARTKLIEADSPAGYFLRERTYDYYAQSHSRLFQSEDGHAGLAVKTDGPDSGEIVSVFTSPGNPADQRMRQLGNLLDAAVEAGGRHFSCYDVNASLLEFYKSKGFVVVANMPTKDMQPEVAATKYPALWNEWQGRVQFDEGRPQGLYLVHDPHRRLADQEICVVQDYGTGCSIQQESLARIDRANYEVVRKEGRL